MSVKSCNLNEFFQKIHEKERKLPDDMVRKLSDLFNMLDGIKKTENYHSENIYWDLETSCQRGRANKHVRKTHEKIDKIGLKTFELIMEIMEYYKK